MKISLALVFLSITLPLSGMESAKVLDPKLLALNASKSGTIVQLPALTGEKSISIPIETASFDTCMYKYIQEHPETRLSLIWPRRADIAEGMKEILRQCGPLLYEKKFALFRRGPDHLFLVAHPTMAKDLAASMREYIPEEMKEPYTFLAVLFETSKSLSEINDIKKKIREYARVSWASIHIDDNHKETCALAHAIFNENPEQLFLKLKRDVFEWWVRKQITKIIYTLRRYLQIGGHLDRKDNKGRTLLFFYAKRLPDLVRILLDEGAPVDTPCSSSTKSKMTPLWVAARSNHGQAVKQLLARGAAIDRPTKDGSTPLTAAALQGCIESVDILIQSGANVHLALLDFLSVAQYQEDEPVLEKLLAATDVNAKDKDGTTALMVAAKRSPLPIFMRILSKGPDVNAQNVRGETALCLAIKGRNDAEEKVALLLQAGADPNKAPDDYTTLIEACGYSHAISMMLIKAGADIMVERGILVPLVWAASCHEFETVRELLKIHPHKLPKTNYVSRALYMSLRYAITDPDKDVAETVRVLLAAGALDDRDEVTYFEHIVLHVIDLGYFKTFQQLIKGGVPLNNPDSKGLTPLLQFIHLRTSQFLPFDLHDSQFFQDHNLPDPFFSNGRHRYADELEAVKVLIAAGADVTIKDPGGHTALDFAPRNNKDLIQILEQTSRKIELTH